MLNQFRTHAALEFAKALCTSEMHRDNPIINKDLNDYIADSAVDLADALISRLAIQPDYGTSPNITAIELPKA
jgi:hypothetical protein